MNTNDLSCDFYWFPYKGQMVKIYKDYYITARAKQLEDNKPNDFLDTFRRHMEDCIWEFTVAHIISKEEE